MPSYPIISCRLPATEYLIKGHRHIAGGKKELLSEPEGAAQ
jgi:hypothetical protein